MLHHFDYILTFKVHSSIAPVATRGFPGEMQLGKGRGRSTRLLPATTTTATMATTATGPSTASATVGR